jgi:hypothetical protein
MFNQLALSQRSNHAAQTPLAKIRTYRRIQRCAFITLDGQAHYAPRIRCTAICAHHSHLPIYACKIWRNRGLLRRRLRSKFTARKKSRAR